MKKNLAWLLSLAGAALLGCSGGSSEPDALQGVIELHQRVLAFQVPGKLAKLEVARGQMVHAGQEIARLDDSLERPQREAQAAEVAAAQAQLDLMHAGTRAEDVRAAEAQLRGAKANEATIAENARRARELRAAGATTPQQLDEAEGALARATADREAAEQRLAALRAGARSQDLRAAQARLEAARAALAAMDARLAEYALRAPIDGEILDTQAEEGEVQGAGSPIATLAEINRPYVDLFVPEAKMAGVRVGAHVEVRTDADPGRVFQGEVEVVGQRTEFTPRYLFSPKERPNLVVRVRVALRDPEAKLRAGLPAFGRFVASDTRIGAAP